MGVKYLHLVWEHSRQSGTALVVMLALADAANDTGSGFCWPKQDTLATKCRVSVRQLRRVLQSLEAAGELLVVERSQSGGRRCYYRVTLPPIPPEVQSDLRETFEDELQADMGVRLKKKSNRTSMSGSTGHGCPVQPDIQGKRIIIKEPEGNQNELEDIPAAPSASSGVKRERPRDLCHDTFVDEAFGGQATKQMRKLIGVQLADIRTAYGVTPAKVVLFVRWFVQRYPTIELTPGCLSGKHWASFERGLAKFYPSVAAGEVTEAADARKLAAVRKLDVGEAPPTPAAPPVVVSDEERRMIEGLGGARA